MDGTFSVIAYFAPGMAMLFLFFIIGDGARSIVAERKQGTLPRILAAPVSPTSVLLGKTAQVMVVGVLSMTAVWLITWLGFGADWGDPVGVFVVIVAAVTAIAGISLLITGFARTENQADALTTIVALLFAVAGGTFFLGRPACWTPCGCSHRTGSRCRPSWICPPPSQDWRGDAAGSAAAGDRDRHCHRGSARTAEQGAVMRAALATARVEWIRFFRDRIAMFSTIALPIVLVLLIGLSFGQSGSRLPVGLLSENPGPLGTV